MGGAPSVQAPKAPDTAQEYSNAMQAYIQNAPQLYQEEAQYQPQYNALQQQMNLQNIQQYQGLYNQMLPQEQNVYASMLPQQMDIYNNMSQQEQATANALQGQAVSGQLGLMQQYGGAATQAMLASNPMYGTMQNFASSQLGAGLDPTLTGLAAQSAGQVGNQVGQFQNIGMAAGADVNTMNQQLGGLASQIGTSTTQSAADLANLRNQVQANTRSDIFNQTAGNIMGQLGQVDPLTQQLKTSASQQLALGSSLSPSQVADAAQQARAAFSARGMEMSNPAMAAEVLNRFQVGQQLLGQREQYASGVSQIADQQAQERVQNAFGLTQADIGATQFNQQLAGQLTNQIAGVQQAGYGMQGQLYGQQAANLQNARAMQLNAAQQAVGAQQQSIQQQSALQQAALGQQFQQQQAGAGIYQYLTGVGQQGMAGVLGAQAQGTGMAGNILGMYQPSAGYASMGSQMNAYGTGGPALFQSSGLLQLEASNRIAAMNAQASANQMNAQSQGQASGAMIGAGASIAGALITGVAAL